MESGKAQTSVTNTAFEALLMPRRVQSFYRLNGIYCSVAAFALGVRHNVWSGELSEKSEVGPRAYKKKTGIKVRECGKQLNQFRRSY